MTGVVAVAYSGGRDSAALLHATAVAARDTGTTVLALHVHHGLLPDADAWVEHACRICDRLTADGLPVRLVVHRVSDAPRPGDSIEAWAREVRYEALDLMARQGGASLVLLAQHRRDQAETFLLQALRGAGVRGLSSMARLHDVDGLTWARPWLDLDRAAITAYVTHHGIEVVEDPSNADPRFERSRLRHGVWPTLQAAFPDVDRALASAAAWAQHARRVLDEVAEDDLARCVDADALNLEAWQLLSPDRRLLALRAWLIARTHRIPSQTLLERLGVELQATDPGRWLLDGGELRCYHGRLRFDVLSAERTTAGGGVPREEWLQIDGPGAYPLPGWGGTLVATTVQGDGVAVAWLGRLDLRARAGGERFQAGPGRPPRSLKKQYQEAEVPTWARELGPLVYSGGQLVFVPGLGLDARVVALPGQAQLSLRWDTAHGRSDDGAAAR